MNHITMPHRGIRGKGAGAIISALCETATSTDFGYIMGNRTGTLYVGMTGFFNTRIRQHKSGLIEGFTRKYKCYRLLYYECYESVFRAKRRELQLKGWRREKKIKLIENMNPRWEDLAENFGKEILPPGKSLKRIP